MMQMIEANWLLIVLALLLGVLIAWYVFHASRKTRVTGESRDVLDEGAAPATRNQALIDAPPATLAKEAEPPAAHPEPAPVPEEAPPVIPPATPAGLAGVGEAVSAAAGQAEERRQEAESDGAPDDLAMLKGVGPKLVAQLHAMGITSFAQIAGWSEADIDRIDAQMGRFQGRIRRDAWVEQAGYLAKGDSEGFAARYGNLT